MDFLWYVYLSQKQRLLALHGKCKCPRVCERDPHLYLFLSCQGTSSLDIRKILVYEFGTFKNFNLSRITYTLHGFSKLRSPSCERCTIVREQYGPHRREDLLWGTSDTKQVWKNLFATPNLFAPRTHIHTHSKEVTVTGEFTRIFRDWIQSVVRPY